MGQPITVVEKPTTRSDVKRFELNRSLTGMGHERYNAGDEITGDRPPDELARRLFATGAVDRVHVFSNEVTVDIRADHDGRELLEVLEELFVHYVPGVEPSKP